MQVEGECDAARGAAGNDAGLTRPRSLHQNPAPYPALDTSDLGLTRDTAQNGCDPNVSAGRCIGREERPVAVPTFPPNFRVGAPPPGTAAGHCRRAGTDTALCAHSSAASEYMRPPRREERRTD